MKEADENTFVGRLRKAACAKSNADLARILGVSPSTITDYARGGYPPVAKMIEIAGKSKQSLDWLLLGRGEETVGVLDTLTPELRSVLETLAAIRERDVLEFVADLLIDGLEALAADLMRSRRSLRPSEMRELKALMKLFEVKDEAAVAIKPSSKRNAR